MTDSRHIAVLTGDLVNSAALGDAKIAHAFRALEACADAQAGWMGAPLHFTRHRGDGWQVALVRPEMALRSALAFRAALRAEGEEFDSYISIATGPAPERLGADLNTHTEEVFTRSGLGLDDLKKTRLPLRMAHDNLGSIDAATILADRLSRGWTAAQAAAMLPTLAPDWDGTHASIARQLGKSRQAVTKALAATGAEVIALALDSLEKGTDP